MAYKIVNFYKFTPLDNLEAMRDRHYEAAHRHNLIGTILLSPEGINAGLAGSEDDLDGYLEFLRRDPRFVDVEPKESLGQIRPYRALYVKVKATIIKFDEDEDLSIEDIVRGKRIAPIDLKRAMDENPGEYTLVDTRNWYETDYGSFEGAEILPIKKFTEFKEAFLERFGDQKERKFVFFCTGGVRCEKAAPWAEKKGFTNVYQLDGGILGYFKEVGSEGWCGKCFVFDHRWIVDTTLNEVDDEDYNLRIQPKPLKKSSP